MGNPSVANFSLPVRQRSKALDLKNHKCRDLRYHSSHVNSTTTSDAVMADRSPKMGRGRKQSHQVAVGALHTLPVIRILGQIIPLLIRAESLVLPQVHNERPGFNILIIRQRTHCILQAGHMHAGS